MVQIPLETRRNLNYELKMAVTAMVLALGAWIVTTVMLFICQVAYEKQAEQLQAAHSAIAGYHTLLREKR
jgi:hypothetical protein